MDLRTTLNKLNLSGVAISAALHADGSLHKVGGLAKGGSRVWNDPDNSARLYALRYLPRHLIESHQWGSLEKSLTDWRFLEAKALAGLVFELAQDFSDAVQAIPHEVRNLRLLEDVLRRDIQFVARHVDDYPHALFQCPWNSCWW